MLAGSGETTILIGARPSWWWLARAGTLTAIPVRRTLACKPARYSRAMPAPPKYPSTPDGRYFVVAGRLWRSSNPGLAPDARQELVDRLMSARRQVGAAKKAGAPDAERRARAAVDEAKRALGERGPVWWTDGAPDFNRRLVANTPYAAWYAALAASAPA